MGDAPRVEFAAELEQLGFQITWVDTVPAHTRCAREVKGANVFLALEHKVALTEALDEARKP